MHGPKGPPPPQEFNYNRRKNRRVYVCARVCMLVVTRLRVDFFLLSFSSAFSYLVSTSVLLRMYMRTKDTHAYCLSCTLYYWNIYTWTATLAVSIFNKRKDRKRDKDSQREKKWKNVSNNDIWLFCTLFLFLIINLCYYSHRFYCDSI